MAADQPLVSIVTPSYNQSRFLEETIVSALSQDYPRLEYIVVDGGSTDGSVEIIRKYADRLAYWVSEPDRGHADAVNKGWRRATGDILAFINSDDVYAPGAVRKAVNWLGEHPDTEIAWGDAWIIDERGRQIGVLPGRNFDYATFVREAKGIINQPSTFMRRSVFEKVGPLNESLHYLMDFEYWIRAGQGCRIQYVPEMLSSFRVHRTSKTVDAKARLGAELVGLYEEFLRLPPSDPVGQIARNGGLAHAYSRAGEQAYAALLPSETRRYLWNAFRRQRSLMLNPELAFKLVSSLGGRRAIKLSRALFQRVTGKVLF